MISFDDFYDKENWVKVPLYLHAINLEALEEGRFEMSIPCHLLPHLVESKVLSLKVGDKVFEDLQEACDYYDTIIEAKEKPTKFPDITWVDDQGKERSFETVATNSKIGTDTLILNMDTAKQCMSAKLGLCKIGSACYALRKEIRTPEAMAKDVRQKEQWACMTAEGLASAIQKVLDQDPEIKYVRLNEAGDFRDASDIEKLKKIAEKVQGVMFYTYSHRSDLKEQLQNVAKNVVINGSGFMLDNAFMGVNVDDYLEVIKGVKEARIKVVNGEKVEPLKTTECIGDCSICDKCKVKRGMNIFLPIHGPSSPKDIKLRQIKNRVLKNPEFLKTIRSEELSDKEKLKKILDMVDVNDLDVVKKLLVLPLEVENLFKNLMADEQLRADFIDSIIEFAKQSGEIDSEQLAADATPVEIKATKAASVLALQGKLTDSIAKAKAKGKKSSELSFTKMKNDLESLVARAKEGKSIAPSKKLATQFRMTTGQKKKTIARKPRR